MKKLNNPLFDKPQNKNVVLASNMTSPVSHQEMILCNIKAVDGKNIPAWVCLQDRVCLPVLKAQLEVN